MLKTILGFQKFLLSMTVKKIIRGFCILLVIFAIAFDSIFRNNLISFGPKQIIVIIVAFIIFFASYISCNGGSNENNTRVGGYSVDIVFIGIFILIAYINYFGISMNQSPSIDLAGDSAILASFGAYFDHPENFAKDFTFKYPEFGKFYVSAFIPILRLINHYISDYGTALKIIYFPSIFIHLFGFYLLGRYLFGNKYLGFLLALITSILINYTSWDYWGIPSSPQPRFIFQAFFPYIVLLGFYWRMKVRLWPILFTFIGVLFYSHTISGVAIAFMISSGYLIHTLPGINCKKRVMWLFISNIVFIIICLPFVKIYLENYIPNSELPYQIAYGFLEEAFPMWLNVPKTFFRYISELFKIGLIPLFILMVPFVIKSKNNNSEVKILILWIISILVFSIILPTIEHAIEIEMKVLPIQMDFPRNLRYTIPLLFILQIVLILSILKRYSNVHKYLVYYYVAFILISTNILSGNTIFSNDSIPLRGLKCMFSELRGCLDPQYDESLDILNYIKNQTTRTDSFLVLSEKLQPEAIRYYAFRSLTYNQREISASLAYIDLQKAIEYSKYDRKKIAPFRDGINNLEIITILSPYCKFSPDFAVLDNNNQVLGGKINLVYSNEKFLLVDISEYCGSVTSTN